MDKKWSEEVEWNERLHFIVGGTNFLAKDHAALILLNFYQEKLINKNLLLFKR